MTLRQNKMVYWNGEKMQEWLGKVLVKAMLGKVKEMMLHQRGKVKWVGQVMLARLRKANKKVGEMQHQRKVTRKVNKERLLRRAKINGELTLVQPRKVMEKVAIRRVKAMLHQGKAMAKVVEMPHLGRVRTKVVVIQHPRQVSKQSPKKRKK